MQTTTQPMGIIPRISPLQQKRYAEMDKLTDIDEYRQLFDSHLDANGRYLLNPEQKKRLDKSKRDIAVGLGISHEVVIKEIDEWLNEE